jgi:hypothetical protein
LAGHVARVRGFRNQQEFLVGKCDRKKIIWESYQIWRCHIKMNLNKQGAQFCAELIWLSTETTEWL